MTSDIRRSELPLALEQAGAYARSSGISLAGYLASFRRRRPEMLARGTPTGYGSTVAATCSLAFTELDQAAPTAVGLLRLLAFCAPEAVPLRLLLQPRPRLAAQPSPQVAPELTLLLDDELAAGDAVAALRRYSLARPASGGAVSVHRLVQAVTADQMPEDLARAWRQAAAALIEAAIPDDPEQPDTWPSHAARQIVPTGGMRKTARVDPVMSAAPSSNIAVGAAITAAARRHGRRHRADPGHQHTADGSGAHRTPLAPSWLG